MYRPQQLFEMQLSAAGLAAMQAHQHHNRAGTDDIGYSFEHFRAFFEDFAAIDVLDIDDLPPADIVGEIDDPSCQHVKS